MKDDPRKTVKPQMIPSSHTGSDWLFFACLAFIVECGMVGYLISLLWK